MTYETWRTIDAPLTESRIAAMTEGEPVHLVIWPGSSIGTVYVMDRTGKRTLTVTDQRNTEDGYTHWKFSCDIGYIWTAVTKADGMAHAATLTRWGR